MDVLDKTLSLPFFRSLFVLSSFTAFFLLDLDSAFALVSWIFEFNGISNLDYLLEFPADSSKWPPSRLFCIHISSLPPTSIACISFCRMPSVLPYPPNTCIFLPYYRFPPHQLPVSRRRIPQPSLDIVQCDPEYKRPKSNPFLFYSQDIPETVLLYVAALALSHRKVSQVWGPQNHLPRSSKSTL